MKIGLIAEDNKLPNYALMKVYAYHKSIGDEVDFEVRKNFRCINHFNN